jgi:hypothetical protein
MDPRRLPDQVVNQGKRPALAKPRGLPQQLALLWRQGVKSYVRVNQGMTHSL